VIDRPFYICTDFVSFIPFICSSNSTGICAEILFGIDIYHSAAAGFGTGILTVALSVILSSFGILYPTHFRAHKLEGWDSVTLDSITFLLHWELGIVRTARDAILIHREVLFFKAGA
jgi:hypothetical protein